MAADVSSLAGILSQYKQDGDGPAEKGDLVTMDLLGNCAGLGYSAEELDIDLDLKVPFGWEKRLDLMSGKVYFQRRSGSASATNSSSSSDPVHRRLQDLNLPPPQSLHSLLEDSSSLDLKLVSSSRSEYQSVCTLDKVKFALERAQRESERKQQKHHQSDESTSPTSSSTTVSSIKRRGGSGREEEVGEWMMTTTTPSEGEEPGGSLMAAVCRSCLLYVLISKGNPRCPRCDSAVPSLALKKPRIDLNSTVGGAGISFNR